MITFVEAKMNQHLFSVKKSSLVLFSLLAGSSMASAENLKINWTDNSNNEDGFIIEKRLQESDLFEIVSTLPANAINFTDSNVTVNQTYCYRIAAFNQAGQSTSDESCLEVYEVASSETPVEPTTPEDIRTPIETDIPSDTGIIYTATDIAISHEFTSKPSVIEVGEKELYSFRSEAAYNEEFSDDSIVNSQFSVSEGKVGYYDRNYFSFQQDGTELANGYALMKFNTSNKLSFDLVGNGQEQNATLYMQAGVWSSNAASVIVTVGNETETITMPKGYAWQYFSVSIAYDGSTPVTISTDSDQGGYSSVMFAGIVLNNAVTAVEEVEEVEAVKYAALLSVDTQAGYTIDVADVEFMTHDMQAGNHDLTDARVDSISFSGKTYDVAKRYNFTDQNGNEFVGYKGMSWKEENGVSLKLQSGESQVNTASLYFSAGAWTRETAAVEVVINGVSEIIELSSGYSWKYMQVDVEFEGELDIDINPVGTIGGYSAFNFAGVTLN